MALSRRLLAKVDGRLRSELDHADREWIVKVPVSDAVKSVWRRYCEVAGVHMGEGLAILLHHELASVADEDLDTLADRLAARNEELDSRAEDVARAERDLERRRQELAAREARLSERQREVEGREANVAVLEERLAGQLRSPVTRSTTTKRKLGRNELCWCQSGKKYKNCHLEWDRNR